MVLGYDYSKQKRRWWRTNVTLSPAILIAMAVHWSNTDGIPQCSISTATLEASGHCHRATTCSVLPRWPPGQQANKQQSTNTPEKRAILMVAAVHRCNTAHIARWRRSRASQEATGCRHRASIATNRCNWSPERICPSRGSIGRTWSSLGVSDRSFS